VRYKSAALKQKWQTEKGNGATSGVQEREEVVGDCLHIENGKKD